MSEQVKMPGRHFLRRDYLHILFYIKFLIFVSLIHQIKIYSFSTWKSTAVNTTIAFVTVWIGTAFLQ